MRLLFVSNQYTPNVVGGAERTMQQLVESCLARGHQVSVASLSPSGKRSMDIVNGVQVHRLPCQNLYYPFGEEHSAPARLLWHVRDAFNPAMARRFQAVLDLEKPEVVCTHNLSGFSVSLWQQIKRSDMQLVHTLHDYYLMCPKSTLYTKGQNCEQRCSMCSALSWPKKDQSRLPDLVLGVSDYVLRKHLDAGYFSKARHAVIHNGRALPESVTRSSSEQLRLGYLGRIEPEKGIETLLAACERLPKTGWQLSIAGRSSHPSYLTELRQRFPLPQVSYLGFVEPQQFYPSVDLAIVPSLWQEPLGNVAFEPLGFGVPVVASRTGGIPEILEGHGCGWLFSPGDVNELTGILLAALAGPSAQEELSRAALKRAEYFTPARQVDAFLEALELLH